MLGRHYPARVVCDSPYDPANERSRMDGPPPQPSPASG